MKYGFIGTGCMGGALATACAKAIGPEDILLSNRSPEKAQALAEKLGAIPADNETITRDCDVIFLGVKPQTMAQMLLPLQPILTGRRTPFVLVSMAAGVTIEALQDMAGGRYPVVRIMPNTACAVGAGLTLYARNDLVTEESMADFLAAMSASGRMEPLPESLIDAGSAVAVPSPVSLWRRWRTVLWPAGCPVTSPIPLPPRCCWARRSCRWRAASPSER